MRIDYQNDFVLVTADNPDENKQIMECLNSAGLFSLPNKIKYVSGEWFISPSIIEKLNRALIPMKQKIRLTEAFSDWMGKYKESRKKLNTDNSGGSCVINVGVVESKIIPNGNKIPSDKLSKKMRYFFEGARNMKSFQDKKWDGYIQLYDKRFHTFPTGLLFDATAILEKEKVPYKMNILYDVAPDKRFDWVVDDGITPDPDQIEAVEYALKGRRGIVKAPTGFGKTAVLAKRLIAARGVPTLFIANKKLLLEDAKEEFLKGVVGLNNVDCIKDGTYGNTKLKSGEVPPQLSAPVVVATIQSLHARLFDERTAVLMKDWLNNVCQFVMVDECQAVGSKMWDEVLKEIHAPYRIMLSATPKRTDGATIKIKAASGPVLFTTTAEEQIAKNRLCELEIRMKKFDHELYNEDDADLVYSDMYKDCIVYNDARNDMLCELADELVKEDRTVLMLVVAIDHGHILKDKLIKMGYRDDDIRMVWGDTPTKKRQAAIEDFRKGKFKILIGSTIFDAGANIPAISGLVLAGAGKADITLIQRIGRAARNCDYMKTLGRIPKFMEGVDKKCSVVYDVLDINAKFFRTQSRVRYYNARDEFGKDRVFLVDATTSDLRSPKKEKQDVDINNMTFNIGGKNCSLDELKKIF